MKSISLLLGAGFSAPQGYPVGNDLNKNILGCKADGFKFNNIGTMNKISAGSHQQDERNNYDAEFEFCIDLIHFYDENIEPFDYEKFYDFIISEAPDSLNIKGYFQNKTYVHGSNLTQLLYSAKRNLTLLVSHFLKDDFDKGWYDDEPYLGSDTWPGYTGILNCLELIGENFDVNVHTLNHDLFFERLCNSKWIDNNYSDGFEEFGSPYFGELRANSRRYMCRLEYYTGNYPNKFKLFKLHGSRDYVPFYLRNGGIDNYIKTRHGIGFMNLFKDVFTTNGEKKYEECWINYHSDFLTGTTSKIERYEDPLLYKKLFKHFKNNLKEAEKLIIIGYGAKDTEINKLLLKHFDFSNKPSFIIDPYPGDAVRKLQDKLGAKLIQKELEFVSNTDIENIS
jgi:hypothetical protein